MTRSPEWEAGYDAGFSDGASDEMSKREALLVASKAALLAFERLPDEAKSRFVSNATRDLRNAITAAEQP